MKTKLIGLLMSAAMLGTGLAHGMEFDPKIYVGGEAQFNKYSFGKKMSNAQTFMKTIDPNGGSFSPKKKDGAVGLFVGSRLNENLGVEAGYSVGSRTKATWTHTTNVGGVLLQNRQGSYNSRTKNMYLDAMGYLPVSCDVDLIGSVGVGRLSTKTEIVDNSLTAAQLAKVNPGKSAKWGPRVGAGAQYKFNENFGVRLMAGYQKGNQIMKNATSAKVGLFYQF